MENYRLTAARYESMNYRYCGKSGLMLSEIALGFWHNFGYSYTPDGKLMEERLPSDYSRCRDIVHFAFDNGITYYDLADNYGPPYGSAEECFGRIMADSMHTHRDEMVIATKAGHDMWPGPYGEWGSRKHIMAGIDQSLKRMGLDYVDIFYSHRPDPRTPLQETLQALVDIVRSGKALYVGISKYPAEMAAQAYEYLAAHDTPCIVYQGKYNMMVRGNEQDILPQCADNGVGYVAFSPLNQGLLTDRYLDGIPSDSRMVRSTFLDKERDLTPEYLEFIRSVAAKAKEDGVTTAQYALRWILQRQEVSSVIVGASSVDQLRQNLSAIRK
ncbi:MAG: aldo/keto reductase [Bacteroidales bacterium]|nr:aldo/keto reductase [Bacteroidales bacterium]